VIIQGADYKFEEVNDYSLLYDVLYLKTINKGKESERKEFITIAYGVPLDTAKKLIVNHRISDKMEDTPISSSDYIKLLNEFGF